MADLNVLQHYLTCAIPVEVECPGHGRGTLVGLPFGHMGQAVRATVHFLEEDSVWNEDIYDLEKVTPVLYSPDDVAQLMATLPAGKVPASWLDIISSPTGEGLNELAQLVDDLRALGVGLGLAPNQYIRREVAAPLPLTKRPTAAALPGQMSLSI